MSSETPRNDLEEAADLAIEAARAYLRQAGLTEKQILVLVRVEDQLDTGDCGTGAFGYDGGASEAFADLFGYISGMAKALGVTLEVVPMPKRGRG